MAAPPAGPVADFCAELRLLVRKCRVSQGEIAEVLGLRSTSTVSELLNGRRRRVPDWDVVRRIVGLCAERNGPQPPPPGMNLDAGYWKSRHAELERTAETAPERAERLPAPPASVPTPRVHATDCVEMGVGEAVRLLAGGREQLMAVVDTLMTPPRGPHEEPRALARLLRHLPARVRAVRGVERAALVQAARVVLVAAAVVRSTNLADAYPLIRDLADGTHGTHASPLAPFRTGGDAVQASRITAEYQRLATVLAAACPEFALVAGVPSAVGGGRAAGPAPLGLAGLGDLLSECAGRPADRAPAGAVLRAPIASIDGPGPRLPSLADGYVTPRYRLAEPSRSARAGVASDKWWDRRPLHDDIERFLAAHVLGLPALLAPLVVLGHPGAGKSLLTKLLTARLPAGEFRPLRVELRHAPAEADLQTQLEHALKRHTGRDATWPDWYDQEPDGPLPVVLLDGFDELLQAGAHKLGHGHQWGYLQEIKEFQRREAGLGRPLIVIVTSRTVVADRADIPYASQVIRLEPFDEPEIERWLAVWNATNRDHFARCAQPPLTLEVVLPHRDLAAQPLLLLMLALYDSTGNALRLPGNEDINRTQLYDRLLREFVRRQVDKDGPLPPAETAGAVDRELHRLSVVALSMFHRGAQAISGEDADRDLRALGASAPGAADDGSGLLFGRFFFVHEAQAVVTEERLRSYEFMHATFGEHLAARLIEQALRRLVTGPQPPDDGELYALLSFAPLTDRAQLVQNLRDMLAAWPADRARAALVPALVGLFRAAGWDCGARRPVAYAPVRLRRAYRDAVYEVNLLLIAVLAAGTVLGSQLVDTDGDGDCDGEGDAADGWRRHALQWQGQLSVESWAALTSTLHVERCRRPDPGQRGAQRPDVEITMQRAPLTDHVLNGSLRTYPPRRTRPLSAALERWPASTRHVTDLIRRVSFAGDRDTEKLVHVGFPVLLRFPTALSLTADFAGTGHRSALQPLLALLTRDVYEPEALPDLYTECLHHSLGPESDERTAYLEAVLRQLVHDAPDLDDEALESVLSLLRHVLSEGEVRVTERMEHALLDCVAHAMDRGSARLADTSALLLTLLARDAPTPLRSLLEITRLSRSTRTWRWSGRPTGTAAADRLDRLLDSLDLPEAGATHPAALIGLLRLAAELGLHDWLAARTAQVLAALPPAAFGLLRPSDLPHLRAALPPDAYAGRFEQVERAWRGP
ncbi:helix-turn-helix domain-containing protein [Streptomyces sp. NPDC046881]|uniref:NACHT domain-containing protein n=1 Tax=Streptomyces sp. NPDC046881 TaxID=3155374 RepID=UPI0033EADCAD